MGQDPERHQEIDDREKEMDGLNKGINKLENKIDEKLNK